MRGPAGSSGDERTPPLPPGYRVGDWEVTEPIASGGWGTVYAGRPVDGDAKLTAGQEDVALKFLPTEGLAPRQARRVAETARREVEFGLRARHPRLIRLLGSLVLSDPGHPFLDGAIVLVMERAAHSLRDLLAEELETERDEAEGARLITEICEGLAHLHRSGWVHGDLKPDNVLIMADGSAKLSDFGLVTELTGTRGTHGYGPPMGTFDYLPPERWKAPLGEHGVQVRPSVDIWALGIMIHEMFTSGASPFPGATPVSRAATAQEYADGRAPLRMDDAVPPFWRALAADCLAPTHDARAAHTAESLLARIAARQDTAPEPADEAGGQSPSEAARRPAGRRGRTRAALVALAVCGALAAGWWYAARDGGSAPPDGTGGHAATASADTESGAAGRVRVFNSEPSCGDRKDRNPECSLGLAIDPLRPYTIDNVVPTRVWHGDVLAVDCQLPKGVPIVDEVGTWSAQWFRVRLRSGSTRSTAWLPAVRTKDRPTVPQCPRPTPVH
ncbi:Serine/threonine-protein kinase StkP [Streptomyces netropsis]|uniref:Serine/threonine-protein kinase n=1 Tax=Streptomyces syringium TaxID=76729 RepID=A0ABS4YCL0_9ACTN|nr:serine/threonine-protein kinase [Streptomyces syringium]MBP2406529.1 serine/threonine-protein kinase [Streptomyces syringium]SPE63576.1 Serine/threonine-protein kinase StkP [Streptomyces netropsis]